MFGTLQRYIFTVKVQDWCRNDEHSQYTLYLKQCDTVIFFFHCCWSRDELLHRYHDDLTSASNHMVRIWQIREGSDWTELINVESPFLYVHFIILYKHFNFFRLHFSVFYSECRHETSEKNNNVVTDSWLKWKEIMWSQMW